MRSPLHGCRCTACGVPALTARALWDPDRVLADAVVCGSCGATFDVVWGAPFLAHYQADDIAGLLEIAANARANAGRNENAHLREPMTVEDVLNSPMLWDPIRYLETCPSSDGAIALVIANEANVWAYNTQAHDTCPIENIWQLTEPEWKGKVALQDPLGKASYIDWFNQMAVHGDEAVAAAYEAR